MDLYISVSIYVQEGMKEGAGKREGRCRKKCRTVHERREGATGNILGRCKKEGRKVQEGRKEGR